MKDNSVFKLGSIASIIVGISYVVIGITGVLFPSNLGGVPNALSPFMYWDANKTMLLTQWWAMFIGAVFALAMIPAVSATVQHLNEGWVRWTSTLAMIAFAVSMLDNYWSIVYTDARAHAFITGSEAIQATLSVPGAPQVLDAQGWLANGAVGLWAFVISVLALRHQVWHKGLAYLGIFGAFVYFLGLLALVIPAFVYSGGSVYVGVLGAVVAPIWFTWMGIYLWRTGSN